MKTHRHPTLVIIVAACLLLTAARADETVNTIKFSDPSKPGTLKINLGRSEVDIQGADTPEVSVRSDANSNSPKARKDNLRVISSASGYVLTEKDNVVSLETPAIEKGRGGENFRITVPRATTVIIQNGWGGDISCTGISGDIDINSLHGEVHLDDISGSAVVSTMNGEINANVRELREGKPLSFTSMNGEVVIRLPANAKANVRLRTHNGSVLTDFDEKVFVTKTESNPGFTHARSKFVYKSIDGKSITAESSASASSSRTATHTIETTQEEPESRSGDAARRLSDDAKRKSDEERRKTDRARRDADQERREGADRGSDSSNARIEIPTISGGKLVTGTLNGGGPEITVSTMNGDVTLRKL